MRIVLECHGASDCILGLGHEELAVFHVRTHERWIRLLCNFLNTVAKHVGNRCIGIITDEFEERSLLLTRHGIMLHHEENKIACLLLVLLNADERLSIVRHREIHTLSCIGGRSLDVGEHLLNFVFRAVHIDITHHDDGLEVRSIPFLIVSTEHIVWEVHDHVHGSNRHTLSIFAAWIDVRERTLIHALHGRAAHTPLLVDHTTFLVDFRTLEQEVVAPVVEDEQTRVERTDTCGLHVVDVVNRLIEAGVGVEVLTEFHTDALEIGLELVAWEMSGSVEAHVLKEVGKSALRFLLLHGSHFLCNVEICTLFRPFVMANVVRESVVELTHPHVGVDRQRLHHLL